MKALRGLYVAVCYILAAPFAMMMGIVMFLTGITNPKSTLKAMAEGIKIGHKQSVQFVKYGRTVI